MPFVRKDTQSKGIDLVLFALAICFFSYAAYSMRKNSEIKAEQQKLTRELEQSSRSPASIGTKGNLETVDLGCLPNKIGSFTAHSSMLRIAGALCSPRKIKNLRATNLASQEEVLVFKKEEEETFVTNYFLLTKGRNEILLQWNEGKKEELNKIEIIKSLENN